MLSCFMTLCSGCTPEAANDASIQIKAILLQLKIFLSPFGLTSKHPSAASSEYLNPRRNLNVLHVFVIKRRTEVSSVKHRQQEAKTKPQHERREFKVIKTGRNSRFPLINIPLMMTSPWRWWKVRSCTSTTALTSWQRHRPADPRRPWSPSQVHHNKQHLFPSRPQL